MPPRPQGAPRIVACPDLGRPPRSPPAAAAAAAAAAAGASSEGDASKAARLALPDSSKDLLKRLAEELLMLHSAADAANQRAAAAEAAADAARREAMPSDVRAEAQHADEAAARAAQATEEAAALRQEVEAARRRAAEADRALDGLHAQLVATKAQLDEARQQRAASDAHNRRLEQQLLQLQQGQPAGQQQEQQQQQQEQQQQAPPAAQQAGARRGSAAPAAARPQPAAAAVAPAAAPRQEAVVELRPGGSGDAVSSRSGGSVHSSEDDETIREPAEPAVGQAQGAAGAGAAAEGDAQQQQQQQQRGGAAPVAAAKEEQQQRGMRPPAKRLPGLHAPVNPARKSDPAAGAGLRKRAAEDAAGAAAPSAKQRRRSSGVHGASPAGGAETEMAAEEMLGLGRVPSTAATLAARQAAAGAQPASPTQEAAEFLALARAGQGAVGGDASDSDGGRRRPGRASVLSKEGDSAQGWLNANALAYVQGLLRDRDFEPFRQPVRGVAGYSDVVRRPMDLGTIKDKAAAGRYRSAADFRDDLKRVVSNAKLFNERPSHPVHQAADRLMAYLEKPRSFYSKVGDEFRQAQLEEVMAKERAAARHEELAAGDAEGELLADQVERGMCVAVYAEGDERKNNYYLLQATGPARTLSRADTDDFGATFKKGERVIEGHYYDYWLCGTGAWDRTRRPYYLQSDKRCLVPAASLLDVDLQLQPRPRAEVSPWDGKAHEVLEVSTELHTGLRAAVKRFLADDDD